MSFNITIAFFSLPWYMLAILLWIKAKKEKEFSKQISLDL